jgi:hypothetical protein
MKKRLQIFQSSRHEREHDEERNSPSRFGWVGESCASAWLKKASLVTGGSRIFFESLRYLYIIHFTTFSGSCGDFEPQLARQFV